MHLYTIPDHQSDQDTNEGLAYLGRFFLEDHMACAALFEVAQSEGCDIHPFEDVRLTSDQVQRLAVIFRVGGQKNTIESSAWQRILAILTSAVEARMGILSFCD